MTRDCASLLLVIASANAQSRIDYCGQLLVVLTDSWPAQSGIMSLFERPDASSWQAHGSPVAVRIGRGGLAWGRGIAIVHSLAGPIKKEGDDKAPAGIFPLRSVFGLTAQTKMPFNRR